MQSATLPTFSEGKNDTTFGENAIRANNHDYSIIVGLVVVVMVVVVAVVVVVVLVVV